jgi:hypothetical protein
MFFVQVRIVYQCEFWRNSVVRSDHCYMKLFACTACPQHPPHHCHEDISILVILLVYLFQWVY